jgi:hypothetical protein
MAQTKQSKLTQLAKQKTALELQTMSRESLKWLMAKIEHLKRPTVIPGTIKAETFRNTNRFILGGMYFFYYDPKGKNELPYYDKFPLVLALEKYDDGFLGLNLHYLPLKYRVAFLDKLLDYGGIYNSDGDPRKIRITYDILTTSRRFREFRPCIKRYLSSHVKSKILQVQPNEWDVATFLPIQQFRGAPVKQIWQESLQEMRNY